MAVARADRRARRRGGRAVLLGPARVRQLAAACAAAALVAAAAGGCELAAPVERGQPDAAGRERAERREAARERRERRERRRRSERRRASAGDFPPPPRDARTARVERVVDGDTVELSGLGSTRLIGVDTPEVYGGVECYGRAASAFAKRVLRPGRRVRVAVGRDDRDRYGRLLAYVWLDDGRLFNGLLVERGYAVPLTIPPNDDLAPRFVAAARRARRAEAGLWSASTCAGDADRRAR